MFLLPNASTLLLWPFTSLLWRSNVPHKDCESFDTCQINTRVIPTAQTPIHPVVRSLMGNLQWYECNIPLTSFQVITLFPRCIKGWSQNLLFHVSRSPADICKTTSELELAARYVFYGASFETSQDLNNRTSLCMSAEEECSRTDGMQPGNYSHIRQLSRVFGCKAIISKLLSLIGTALTALEFVWEMFVHICVNLWPFELQLVACAWKNK